MKSLFWSLTAHRASSQEMTRLYQLAASVLAAFLLWFTAVETLIDQTARITTSLLDKQTPSGEILLLDIDSKKSFAQTSVAKRQAEAVMVASEAGAEALFIDGSFSESDSGIPALRNAIIAAKTPVTIGWPISFGAEDSSVGVRVDRKAVFPGAQETLDANWLTMTGFVAEGVSPIEMSGRRWTSFAAAIAGIQSQPGEYVIDYRYRIEELPTYTLADLREQPALKAKLRGKRVVISAASGSIDKTAMIPDHWRVPMIFVTTISAETLRSGPPLKISWSITFSICLILLYIAALLPRTLRRNIYGLTIVMAVVIPFALAPFGVVVMFGRTVSLLLIYFVLRLRVHWRERAAGIERLSGLPNFHSLEDDYPTAHGRLIIAKVENYEEILASLEPIHHGAFIHHIAQRLSLGGSTRIYTDTTGHFAWFDELEHAKSHVAGLLALTSAPILIGDRTLDFSCSFGLLDCAIDKPRQAISATVVAAGKGASRPTHVSYVSEQEGFDANWQLSLLASLDQAISKEQIYLAFQPQRSLSTGKIVGVEALVRWRHPDRGVISPSQFIPQIERAGRLKPLTAHTLRLAARASEVTMASGIRVSVNVSATLISDDDFPKFVHDNILAGGGRPDGITVEITETARIPDLERASRNLEKLKQQGYDVALDDFGTGEANLSLLVALPCDELKIDRSFVVLAQHSERARMVISALSRTARLSSIRLVAEGIETEEDRETLRILGCEVGQGYLLGRPQLFAQLLQLFDSEGGGALQKLRLY